MSEIIAIAKPFLKWVGGKTQLLDEISKYYPEKIEKYCEPFVGGGAVLFDVLTKFQPKEVLINEINPELTNTYVQIKDNVNDLILAKEDSVEKAALMIYLNKTCFNGLYRVNGKGLYNVPSGVYKNTFVYIDPPYRPLTKTSAFTSYSKEGFDDDKQIELGNLGVPAKAVGCSTLRYRSSSSLRCGGLLRRCSIA